MGQYKSAAAQETTKMTAELQAKKKWKKNGKRKKQESVEILKPSEKIICDIEEEAEPDYLLKEPLSDEEGLATFSGCSKTLFLAVILVASGLAILSSTTNISVNSFGQPDILANYGKESLLPNLQGLELDFLSIESLAGALSSSLNSLEDVGNGILHMLSEVLTSCAEFGESIYNTGVSVFSDSILIVGEAFAKAVHPLMELSSAFSIINAEPESTGSGSSSIVDEEFIYEEAEEFDNEDVAQELVLEETQLFREFDTAEAVEEAEAEADRITAEEEAEVVAAKEEAEVVAAKEAEAARVAAEQEIERIAEEEAEAVRIAAEKAAAVEAERIVAAAEATRIIEEEAETARIAAEEAAAAEAARIAEEVEAARVVAEEAEAARIVAEEAAAAEAARIVAEAIRVAAEEAESA